MTRTAEWVSQLEEITVAFEKDFSGLTEDELNLKPSATQWSIAQNIDHLIVINSTYFPLLKQVHEGTLELPWIAKFNFIVNWMGGIILKSVQPDRRKKMRTFPKWEPAVGHLGPDLIKRFRAHQEDLKQVIEHASTVMANDPVIYSPANKNIVYRLSTAFDIIIAHERRHLEQAREVKVLIKK